MTDGTDFPIGTETFEHAQLGGQLGVFRIAAIVIAFSAPLAVVAGYLAVVIALGNGLGAPLTFLLTGIILLFFAVGFTELVKALPIAGGFYVYITAGLGRPAGVAGIMIALLSYSLLAVGTYAFLALTASRLVADELGGPHIPWGVFVAGTWLLSTILSYRELSVSAKLISVLILFEFALILGFDMSVLLDGGLNGLPIEPFQPVHLMSGAPGLAFMFAAGMFLGFESTAVYRDEAHTPEKTIPRATFLTIGFMTIFYAATTYFLIASMGASQAIEIASRDPAKAFPLALAHEFGHWAVITGYVLLCTSLYGAVLSMHNVLARYIFRMARGELLPAKLARIHPRHRAPSTASLAVALVLGAIMLPFPLIYDSPELLYAKQVGVGSFGFIFLVFLTALAVVAYFLRGTRKLPLFRARVAPIIAAVGMLFIFVLSNRNFVDLVGTDAGAADAILMGIYGFGVAGVLWALWLRARRPKVYAMIGTSEEQ